MKQDLPTPPYDGKAFAIIAIALCAGGAVFFVISFFVLGIYGLIASVTCELGALCFVNIQKKKNNLSWLKFVNICAYVVLGLAAAVFVGGLIWSVI